MVVLGGGTQIDKAEEERSARAGTYFGMSKSILDTLKASQI